MIRTQLIEILRTALAINAAIFSIGHNGSAPALLAPGSPGIVWQTQALSPRLFEGGLKLKPNRIWPGILAGVTFVLSPAPSKSQEVASPAPPPANVRLAGNGSTLQRLQKAREAIQELRATILALKNAAAETDLPALLEKAEAAYNSTVVSYNVAQTIDVHDYDDPKVIRQIERESFDMDSPYIGVLNDADRAIYNAHKKMDPHFKGPSPVARVLRTSRGAHVLRTIFFMLFSAAAWNSPGLKHTVVTSYTLESAA